VLRLGSITGITGVNLNGGQQYFMIVGPLSTADTGMNGRNCDNQGVNGLVLSSTDGGSTWVSDGSSATTGAFDVLSASDPALAESTPEPLSASVRNRIDRNALPLPLQVKLLNR
jgi:hypothetical protein